MRALFDTRCRGNMKKTFLVRTVFVFSGLLFLIGPGCATNADLHNLNNRISELEKRHRELNSSFENLWGDLREEISSDRDQGHEIREMFAVQDAAVDSLRVELRKLHGELEESQYRTSGDIKALQEELENTGKKIDSLTGDLNSFDKRLSRLEKFMGMEKSESARDSSDSGSPDKAELEQLGEDELYSVSKQAYDEGDHETAIEGFELFLEKFPDSDMADNARFWIGEVFFAEKWYEKAILEYEKVIKNYPDGNKVPGAYLKQGIAFHKLGENANARLILQTLLRKYPESDESEIAKRQIAIID